jgi:hypothetical protein
MLGSPKQRADGAHGSVPHQVHAQGAQRVVIRADGAQAPDARRGQSQIAATQ